MQKVEVFNRITGEFMVGEVICKDVSAEGITVTVRCHDELLQGTVVFTDKQLADILQWIEDTGATSIPCEMGMDAIEVS